MGARRPRATPAAIIGLWDGIGDHDVIVGWSTGLHCTPQNLNSSGQNFMANLTENPAELVSLANPGCLAIGADEGQCD
jgi:hypothetical protein